MNLDVVWSMTLFLYILVLRHSLASSQGTVIYRLTFETCGKKLAGTESSVIVSLFNKSEEKSKKTICGRGSRFSTNRTDISDLTLNDTEDLGPICKVEFILSEDNSDSWMMKRLTVHHIATDDVGVFGGEECSRDNRITGGNWVTYDRSDRNLTDLLCQSEPRDLWGDCSCLTRTKRRLRSPCVDTPQGVDMEKPCIPDSWVCATGSCGHCIGGAVCDSVTGECPMGNPRCATGYVGTRCLKFAVDYNRVIIGCVASVSAAVVVVTAMVLVLRRRRQPVSSEGARNTVISQEVPHVLVPNHFHWTRANTNCKSVTKKVHSNKVADGVYSHELTESVNSLEWAKRVHSHKGSEEVRPHVGAEWVHPCERAESVYSREWAERVHPQNGTEEVHPYEMSELVYPCEWAQSVHSHEWAERVHPHEGIEDVHLHEAAEWMTDNEWTEGVYSDDATEEVHPDERLYDVIGLSRPGPNTIYTNLN